MSRPTSKHRSQLLDSTSVILKAEGWPHHGSSFSTDFRHPLLSVFFPSPHLSTEWCCL